MTKERTGVLGGRFDPIHLGHLETAAAARVAFGLDQVLLVPSGVSPHRAGAPAASDADRLAMVTLAARSVPELVPCDLELRADGPSYTARTLARLHDRGYSRTQLFFVLGADAFEEIATWHDYPAVLEAAHFVVVARPGHAVADLADLLPALRDRMRPVPPGADTATWDLGTAPGIWLLDVVTPSVSSTHVRACLARRQPVTDLIPTAVATYIADHGLYDAGPAMSLHD
jgi:nicotinate-nucleotide adenylyltransferase